MQYHTHPHSLYSIELWPCIFKENVTVILLLISSHFEHYGSVSVPRAQCKCIGHGPRSRFRSVRSEMKSTVTGESFRTGCVQSMRMGTRLCKEWENNFPTQLQCTVLLISSHFEHYGSVSVARAQYICIGHGARSRFRSVRSEMKSTVVFQVR